MFNLDLNKNNIDNFNTIERDSKNNDQLQQDINRSWEFLKKTHTLQQGECIAIRVLVAKRHTKRNVGNNELIVTDFDLDNYISYSNFIRKYSNHRDADFNFYYNIYNLDYLKCDYYIHTHKKSKYKDPQAGIKENVSSTSLLAADFDDCTFEEYKEIRKAFLDKGIVPIEISSGHGYHILIKIHNKYDINLQEKWTDLLKDNGFNVDTKIKNPGRVLRLPFFWNIKEEYDTVSKCQIIEGEYGEPTIYDAEWVFDAFGGDINHLKEEKVKYINTPKNTPKKANKEVETSNYDFVDKTLEELYPNYPIFSLFPTGIQNMLKGFRKGFTHYQIMCLVVFFKKYGYTLEEIIEILGITESIRGNSWNSFDVKDKVVYFYENFSGVANLNDLREEFGEIYFIEKDYKETYKVPLAVAKAAQVQLYLFLLKNGPSKKVDILKGLGISNNKLDRQMQGNKIIEKRGDNKYYLLNVISEHYVYLSENEVTRLLNWKQNDIVVYLYLRWRCGESDEVRTSIKSIEKDTLLSHTSISKSIQNLEFREVITVTRNKENHKKFLKENRESNLYKLKKL